MHIDWLNSLRVNSTRRNSSLHLGTPHSLESRTLLSATSVGPEFRVNTFTSLSQGAADVASDADGDFVVVWNSSNQDGSGLGIYAQRYNAAGTPQGSEFKVNSTVSRNQSDPVVAMDAAGNFTVAWESYEQDGSWWGIYAQRYNSSGTPQGPEFLVNTWTANYQREPDIAMDANGHFVVTWYSVPQDGGLEGIYAQRFDPTGTREGGEFRVNTWTTDEQTSPTVAMDADGDFVIAWRSYLQDGAEYGVFAQRFDSLGVAQGAEFQVNTHSFKSQLSPSVGMSVQGDFVIAWESYLHDGSSDGIYAQRYNSLGVPQGAEFLVNSFTIGQQRFPAVAVDSQGDFVITWQTLGPDGDGYGIYAQRYNSDGSTESTNFRVNTFTSGWQLAPTVAMDSDGDLVFAWQSAAQDGSSYGVFAQRFLKVGQRDVPGVWREGKFYLDSNHSGTWNGPATDARIVIGDPTDTPLVGDWNGDSYDEIGYWCNGTFSLDTNGNGFWDGPATDAQFPFGNPTDTPLVGDWNNDGIDDIGVWRAGKFYLDLNGNRAWNGPAIDTMFAFGIPTDQPIIGDWNGDGTDDVGVRRDQKFYLDANGNRMWNIGVDEVFGFGNPSDTPIVGDWNGDGIDDIGVWRAGQFYLDSTPDHFWNGYFDQRVPFGTVTDTPLIGYWRPKTIPGTPPAGALPPSSSQVSVPAAAPQPDGETLASLLAAPSKKRDR